MFFENKGSHSAKKYRELKDILESSSKLGNWSIPKRKIYQNNFIYTNKKSNNQDFYQVAFSRFIGLNFLYLGS